MAAPIPSIDLIDPSPVAPSIDASSTQPKPNQDTELTWTPVPIDDIDKEFATSSIDLIASDLGGKVLHVSDEWFAEAKNLINPEKPIRRAGVFDARGAWYDGWESRRHNCNPPDSCTISLAPTAGRPTGIEIDTAHFDGNHAELVSVLYTNDTSPDVDTLVVDPSYPKWQTLLPNQKCEGNTRHAWKLSAPPSSLSSEAESSPSLTHVKLLMYPDGGIARFRLYGHAMPVFPFTTSSSVPKPIDLASALNGAIATAYSDQHFGRAANLLLPGRGHDMRDGWETARSRSQGHEDWVVVRLCARGKVGKVVVDTMHFRGNYPQSVEVWGRDGESTQGASEGGEEGWTLLGGVEQCEKDKEHEVVVAEREEKAYTYVKLVIVPDGGVKRLRVWGVRV